MGHHFEFVIHLVDKGGPDTENFYDLDAWVAEIAVLARNGVLATDDLAHLREALGEANSFVIIPSRVSDVSHHSYTACHSIWQLSAKCINSKPKYFDVSGGRYERSFSDS